MKFEATGDASSFVTAYIALGANLEDPRRQVLAGIDALTSLPRTQWAAASSLYRTSPVGYADQPDFINAVVCICTALTPRALLEHLLAIERTHGRVREFPNAPRTLDLDILLYGEQLVDEPGLTIPHPRMHERAFVLAPLAEIAPEITIPGRGRARDLLAALGTHGVEKLITAAA
jgi:2-amino-4-hydroxy-6-hydroxymethyldihydropteridine diphosphokinase